MLRHKAMIQCARLAFGYVGIYEQGEAERIMERHVNARPARQSAKDIPSKAVETVEFIDADERANLLADLEAVANTGAKALETTWQVISKEQRKTLAGELDTLEACAAKADQPAEGGECVPA
jgi:hypothetical protein